MAKPQKWSFTFPTVEAGRRAVEGPFYELTGGILFPEWVEVLATPEQPTRLPHAKLRLEIEKGRPVCTSLTVGRSGVGGRAIEASTFRELDIAGLINSAIEWQAHNARAIVDLIIGADSWTETPSGGRVFRDTRNTAGGVRKLRRQWADTDDKLRQVAEVYSSDKTGAPTVAVMEHFELLPTERRKAARWIAEAKDRFPEIFEEDPDGN